jgi:hypothetical protein
MPEQANKFSRRSNENLLQLWKGRGGLDDEDIDPLRDELDKRGLSKEAEEIVDQFIVGNRYGELPVGPQTYGNLSVPFWALRELWLKHKTSGGIPIEATISMVQRTGSRNRSASRVELLYSYEFQGGQYDGRVVRDFNLSDAADSFAYDHHRGEKLHIIVCRNDPKISYYPSGLGFIQAILLGVLYSLVIGFLVTLTAESLLDKFH